MNLKEKLANAFVRSCSSFNSFKPGYFRCFAHLNPNFFISEQPKMERTSNLLDEAMAETPKNSVVLIEDCVETSGAFVLHHLMKRSLSPQSSSLLIFVAFAHPFSHYDRILRKLVILIFIYRDYLFYRCL